MNKDQKKQRHPTSKRNRKINNHTFSDSYVYTGVYDVETTIRLLSYDKNGIKRQDIPVSTDSFMDYIQKDHMNWFIITGLTDYNAINSLLRDTGFDDIDGKDVLTPDHVVKIDDYSDQLSIVMRSCFLSDDGGIASEHICILIKENLVLSFSEKSDTLFSNVEKSLEENVKNIRSKKTGMLLAFMLNAVFGQLIDTALYIGDTLEKLEDQLLDTNPDKPDIGSREIQEARHGNLIIQRNTFPLKEEFDKLLKEQPGIIDKSMRRLFTELGDQLEYIIQTSRGSKEILSSLESLYVSHNDLKMNAIMKRLTIVSTLFIPITFLVGLWGMNFKFMPEIYWEWGYIISLGILLVTAATTWMYMKKKKWF